LLISQIEQTFCKLAKPDIDQLKAAILSLGPHLSEVKNYKTEPEQLPYGRNVLLRTDELEVIVIHIPGHQQTAIHDHGESVGCAYVVEGELMNTICSLDKDGFPQPEAYQQIRAGECFTAPSEQIHELANLRDESMISFHVYAPPLKDVKRYIPYVEGRLANSGKANQA
jgi:cysteine dioxygenase